jgi:adenine phosphoribosyltransferase
MSAEEIVRSLVRDVPDFPKEGILFRDITPVLGDPAGFRAVLEHWAERFGTRELDAIVGIESRGFIFGAPLAVRLGVPFVPVRKPGKLPCETVSVEYALEYGTDRIEMHRDAFPEGARVLVVDDLLATGGTAEACCRLVEEVGGRIEAVAFVIELAFLEGREKLAGRDVDALVVY